ncbi:PREDICTED: uncharacterized protein LOC105567343 [Vollenhovia emeryi]|uniref:uncharacterized protein LOC105567343 n=1 Tax=Vollenhovia emeryi TaxID=411798 RepID=UPI0005F44CBA|nr:PREDICTED: uncharacterized protein LOC105567343 [Vollenhovia emeryi]
MDRDPNNYLRLCHVNCQSLVAHLDEIRYFFADSGYHCICISESWLKPCVTDNMVSLQGYQLVRHDRIGRVGGGVAIYVNNALHASFLCQSDNKCSGKPEYLMIEILIKNCAKVLLAVVYRPPHCGFLSDFFSVFSSLSVNYRHSIIFGDFNANLEALTFDSCQIKSFVEDTNLFMVPFSPTHHTGRSSTTLDLCILDGADKMINYKQCDVNFLSAHDLIEVTYNIKIQHLDTKDWEEFFKSECIDEKVRLLNKYILDSYDRHAPFRDIQPRHLPAPWLTADVRALMKTRDGARRNWRRRRTEANYIKYKKLRNEAQIAVRKAKIGHYHEARTESGSLACTAEELNEHLVDQKQNNNKGTDPQELLTVASLGQISYNDNKFYWKHIEPMEVISSLRRIRSGAVGRDELPLNVILKGLPSVLPAILHILNYSLTNGIYPGLWKSAIICPIPKIKTPKTLNDYRPISILCAISKVIERIAADQIVKYLEERDLADPFQSAYKRDNSTQTALVRVIDDIRCAADRRMISVAVFFDFSRAFDNVCHQQLLTKLSRLGFAHTTLLWIHSYLTGRGQAVRDPQTGELTSELPVKRGVPQGSVLGPLLFTLYLRDFSSVLRHCKYHFYAVDLLLYMHEEPKYIHEAIRRFNLDIESVVTWASDNKLAINPNKTKAMVLGTLRHISGLDRDALPDLLETERK